MVSYVGKTKRSFIRRMMEHVRDILNNKCTSVSKHYNQEGHHVTDAEFHIVEKEISTSSALARREISHIHSTVVFDDESLNQVLYSGSKY